MSDKREITERAIEHPIEDILEIEPGTTYLPSVESVSTDVVVTPEFDEMDVQINEQFQEIYDTAMDAYEQQAEDSQTIDPKYRARNHEVAVQYLNTALNAAKERNATKMAKDKLANKAMTGGGPKTLNQNVIVADRNDILKEIFNKKDGQEE